MQRRSIWLVLGALATAGVACSSPTTNTPPGDSGTTDVQNPTDTGGGTDVQNPTDRPVTQDGGTMDVPVAMDGSTTDGGTTDGGGNDVPKTTDGGGTDVPRTDGGATDGGTPYDPCASSAVIDLNAMGTTAGTTTRITRDNNGVGPSAPLPGFCGRPGHEVVFRYTPRTSARLRISTDNAGTNMNLDTVVWAQTTCSAGTGDAGATSLGCSDDSGTAPRTRTSVFTTSAATTMGTPIFIVVAGYTPTTGTPYLEQGAFELSVTEIPTVAVGGACDPAGVTSVCATASRCATNPTDGGTDAGATGTCIADGAINGNCRTVTATVTACDTGLACSIGRCVTAIPVGGSCATGVTGACATGSTCLTTGTATDGGAAPRTCVADGSRGGVCRTATATVTACDTGLGCNDVDRCVTTVASGGSCDPTGATNLCAAGTFCVRTGDAGTGTCQAGPFAEAAITAPSFVDACAMGTRVALAGTALDDNHAMAAITIPFSFQFYGAAQTSFWPSTNGYGVFGTTEPDDVTGGPLPLDEANVVAPFLDDLVVRPAADGGAPSGICQATVGAMPNRRFVVEWQNVYRYSHSATVLTFELVLNETSNTVEFLYQTLTPSGADAGADGPFVDGSNADIGLAGPAGSAPVTHVGTVSTTAGIRFTPR